MRIGKGTAQYVFVIAIPLIIACPCAIAIFIIADYMFPTESGFYWPVLVYFCGLMFGLVLCAYAYISVRFCKPYVDIEKSMV